MSMIGSTEALSETEEVHLSEMRPYRMPAKVLHWLTAVLVLGMIACGVIAKQFGDGPVSDALMNWHKLTGVLILAIVVIRLMYRLLASAPERGMRVYPRSKLHWLLYGIVLMVPLLGWAGVSDFGAREIALGIVLPAIWPEGAGYDELLLHSHAYAAFVLLALVALHVGLAVKDTVTAGQSGHPATSNDR